jgi:hypothetical protein
LWVILLIFKEDIEMKNLLILLTVVLGFNAYGVINAPMSNQYDATGALTRSDVVDIKVKCGEAGSAGDVMTFDLTADDGAKVEQGDVLGEAAACVLVEACAANALAKCRVYGKISANHSGTGDNAVAGVPVFVSPSDGKVTGITSPSGHNYPVGIALDASSSTEALEVFVQLL